MSNQGKTQHHPNLKFSHFGFAVHDLELMGDFYTRVLDFTVTDRGHVEGMDLIFLSRDPDDHHQIVLASGKPQGIPEHPFNPQFGSVINQISFKVSSLAELRRIHGIFVRENVSSIFPANHGIAWSIYAHDPEGNNLEFFVDTDWYFPQPFLVPLDFAMTDTEIQAATEKFSREQEAFEPYSEWRNRFANRMNAYRAYA